jgi:hypothetical protein
LGKQVSGQFNARATGDRGHEARTESTTQRLGLGEFVDASGMVPLSTARFHFLNAILEVCPNATEELRRLIRPAAATASDASALSDPVTTQMIDLVSRALVALAPTVGLPADRELIHAVAQAYTLRRHPSVLAPVKEQLKQWMLRWRLPADDALWWDHFASWTAGLLVRDLGRNERAPDQTSMRDVTEGAPRAKLSEYARALQIAVDEWLPDAKPVTAELFRDEFGSDITITPPSYQWNPRFETRANAQAAIMQQCAREVRRQLDAAEAELKSAGALPTPLKSAGVEHFQWLARYQVNSEPYAAISRSAFRSRQAVMAAIQDTARLILLPLREPDRRGRPSKPKTPRTVIVKVRTHQRSPGN